jgi:N-acetyl-anhydromuramyl-L-alanine amidase AmpD
MPLPEGSPEPDLLAVLQYLHFLTKQVERRSLSRWWRSRGDAVKVVQQRLITHGYNPGPIDGIFGRQTATAVSVFQKARNLRINGVVNLTTWNALLT